MTEGTCHAPGIVSGTTTEKIRVACKGAHELFRQKNSYSIAAEGGFKLMPELARIFEKPLSKAIVITQAKVMDDLASEKNLTQLALRLFASDLQVVCHRSLELVLSVKGIYPEGWWVQNRIPQPRRPRRERHWPRRFPAPPFSSLFVNFEIELGDCCLRSPDQSLTINISLDSTQAKSNAVIRQFRSFALEKKTCSLETTAARAYMLRPKTLEELAPIPDQPGAGLWRLIYPEGPLPRMPRRPRARHRR